MLIYAPYGCWVLAESLFVVFYRSTTLKMLVNASILAVLLLVTTRMKCSEMLGFILRKTLRNPKIILSLIKQEMTGSKLSCENFFLNEHG